MQIHTLPPLFILSRSIFLIHLKINQWSTADQFHMNHAGPPRQDIAVHNAL